ncbi:DMT family transporter [Nonomuraea sp. CA-143628]|uniref:DMT family transporter n=1 Tax=Nonomuraea sp. CA-143628 TaxID=3239997 RepID=UPI003D8AF1BA
MSHVSARRGAFFMSVAATAWGTGGAAGSLLFQSGGLGPVDVSFWRYLLGAAFLYVTTRLTSTALRPSILRPVVVRRAAVRSSVGRSAVVRPGDVGRRRPSALWARFDRRVLVVGFGMAVYQTAYFGAISQSGVAVATVVTMGSTPVFTALGSRFLLGERIGRTALAALVAALGGLLLLTGESAFAGESAFSGESVGIGRAAGIILALVSAAGYAGVTVFSRTLHTRTLHSGHHRDDPQRTAMGGFAVAAACLAPFALVDGVLPTAGATPVALLLYLGAVPTALAYGLFFRALTALNATTVSIISLGEAVGAAVLGVVLFGERLTPMAWCGCALLLAAVVVPAVQAGRTTEKD